MRFRESAELPDFGSSARSPSDTINGCCVGSGLYPFGALRRFLLFAGFFEVVADRVADLRCFGRFSPAEACGLPGFGSRLLEEEPLPEVGRVVLGFFEPVSRGFRVAGDLAPEALRFFVCFGAGVERDFFGFRVPESPPPLGSERFFVGRLMAGKAGEPRDGIGGHFFFFERAEAPPPFAVVVVRVRGRGFRDRGLGFGTLYFSQNGSSSPSKPEAPAASPCASSSTRVTCRTFNGFAVPLWEMSKSHIALPLSSSFCSGSR